MKANITLNIGLTIPAIDIHRAIHEIERAGITCLASGVVQGVWEGKPEQTLVIQGLAFESPELKPRLYLASRALSQHSIAVHCNGKGELIGDNPQGYQFDPQLFHFHAREERVALSPCQAIQAKHREKADCNLAEDREINGWNAPQFVTYLQETLIPDLKDAGRDATAEDFETAVGFLSR